MHVTEGDPHTNNVHGNQYYTEANDENRNRDIDTSIYPVLDICYKPTSFSLGQNKVQSMSDILASSQGL